MRPGVVASVQSASDLTFDVAMTYQGLQVSEENIKKSTGFLLGDYASPYWIILVIIVQQLSSIGIAEIVGVRDEMAHKRTGSGSNKIRLPSHTLIDRSYANDENRTVSTPLRPLRTLAHVRCDIRSAAPAAASNARGDYDVNHSSVKEDLEYSAHCSYSRKRLWLIFA